MVEMLNTLQLTNIEQSLLFISTAALSMLYHYVNAWVATKQRMLNSFKNIWKASTILFSMLIGSSVWTHMYDLSNIEVVAVGLAIGLAAFSEGYAKFDKVKQWH